VPAGAVIQNP